MDLSILITHFFKPLKEHVRRAPNDVTLEAYNKEALHYIKETPENYGPEHIYLLKWIDAALSQVPMGGKILEIGSGSGREAQYMRQQGHLVQCSDGAHSFVRHLRQKGEDVIVLNVLKDEIPGTYDMIFANAVFPHFTKQDTLTAIRKAKAALAPKGLLAFDIKQGNGEIWVKEKLKRRRFIHYWHPDELVDIVESLGFEITYCKNDSPGDLPTHVWTHLIAKKV